MVTSNDQYLSNSLEYVYQSEIGQRTKYTANTGTVLMTAANSNLDGTGTLYTVLAGSDNGTLVKNLTIKGAALLSKGMVRFYIEKFGGTTALISEIEIPSRDLSAIQQSFAVSIDVDFFLQNRDTLKASTENAEAIVITAEGLDITYP